MSKDYQLKVNVHALGEAFLVNNAKQLTNVNQLVIQLIDKDETLVDEQTIDVNDLPNQLCKIFEDDVSDLKSINIFYIKYGLRYYLTDITIF